MCVCVGGAEQRLGSSPSLPDIKEQFGLKPFGSILERGKEPEEGGRATGGSLSPPIHADMLSINDDGLRGIKGPYLDMVQWSMLASLKSGSLISRTCA